MIFFSFNKYKYINYSSSLLCSLFFFAFITKITTIIINIIANIASIHQTIFNIVHNVDHQLLLSCNGVLLSSVPQACEGIS